MITIQVKCKGTIFNFSLETDEAAWFDFDHMVSKKYGQALRINADREVYGIYTGRNGKKYYGTIGDDENQFLPDNDGCPNGYVFTFYENPKTKRYYV